MVEDHREGGTARMDGNKRGKRLVVLTGAGMSAESGLKTFRDAGGLWEEYDVMEVASIEGSPFRRGRNAGSPP